MITPFNTNPALPTLLLMLFHASPHPLQINSCLCRSQTLIFGKNSDNPYMTMLNIKSYFKGSTMTPPLNPSSPFTGTFSFLVAKSGSLPIFLFPRFYSKNFMPPP